MAQAILWAKKARNLGEVPVGAVLVLGDSALVFLDHNRVISHADPTAHAEILVLRQAARRIENYRLTGAVLYATIEPCVMCMGAAIHARVARIVYGAPDPGWGAAGSLYRFEQDARFNHQPVVKAGVEGQACADLIRGFFKEKREIKRQQP